MTVSSSEQPPTQPDEPEVELVPAAGPGGARHRLGDLLGIAWIALFVLLFLSPAIKDGPSFGPADLGTTLSALTNLGAHGPVVHNNLNGDIVTQDAAWNALDWRLVRHGELPLWDGLAGNGLPELLNFESAALALPSLVGYLFPLSLAFLVTVAMKLLIAGTGVYVLLRLLGCRPVAAAMGGTTFMLSGSFAGWLGWAIGGPLAWSGWVLAGCLLAYRGRHRARGAAVLAVSVAFAIFGGFPETYVLMAIGLALLLGVSGALSAILERRVSWSGVAFVAAGTAGGLALASPLWLPGVAVIRDSIREGRVASTGIPLHFSLLVFAQGYDGLPLQTASLPAGSWIGTSFNYNETAAYVGVVALVLAIVAVLVAWRRPIVVGLVATLVASCLIVYNLGPHAPVQRLITRIGLEGIALQRMLIVLGLAVAVLAGIGLEHALRRWREPGLQLALALAVLAAAAVLALMWAKAFSNAPIPEPTAPGPSVTAGSIRRAALLWPSGELLGLLLLAAALPVLAHRTDVAVASRPATHHRRGRIGLAAFGGAEIAAVVALGVQSAFLLFAGVGYNSYAPTTYPTDAAVGELQRLVGNHLLGLDGQNEVCAAGTVASCGVRYWTGIGLYPEMNVVYGVDELAVHDPLAPKAYFDSWPVPDAGQEAGGLNLFAPAVDNVALARRYGVQFLLVQRGVPVPAGTHPVATIEGPTKTPLLLVAVPGSSQFSFTAGRARVVTSSHPGDASYDLRVRVPGSASQQLVLRLTDVPGWHVTADGRPLAVRPADGTFLSVEVPAGTTSVVATYRPALFQVGSLLALLAVIALVLLVALEARLDRANTRS